VREVGHPVGLVLFFIALPKWQKMAVGKYVDIICGPK